MPRDVFEHLRELSERHPEIEAEYQRLGPRYAVISALIKARKRAKVTQAGLAERMHVTPAVVSRLESADHDPRLNTLAKAAAAIGYRVDVRFVPVGAASPKASPARAAKKSRTPKPEPRTSKTAHIGRMTAGGSARRTGTPSIARGA